MINEYLQKVWILSFNSVEKFREALVGYVEKKPIFNTMNVEEHNEFFSFLLFNFFLLEFFFKYINHGVQYYVTITK